MYKLGLATMLQADHTILGQQTLGTYSLPLLVERIFKPFWLKQTHLKLE